MGAHDGEPHESLWKVFQLPSGGPVYLYIGDEDTGYQTVRVRVLDEAAMELCPKPPPDALAITDVRASSSLRASGGYRFTPQQVIDGDLSTSWQPTLKKGESPWIELALDGEHEVTAIDVANGFQRRDGNGDLFVMNARAAELTITWSDGSSERTKLSGDARGYQSLELKRHRTSTVRITIMGTYPGTRWPEDVALSELRVRGE
jgi:hypothetical protein